MRSDLRLSVLLVAAFALVLPPAGARAGDEQTVLGTVRAVEAGRLDVESREGPLVRLVLTAETLYIRGDGATKREEIELGERVVAKYVTREGEHVALEVKLAVRPHAGHRAPPPPIEGAPPAPPGAEPAQGAHGEHAKAAETPAPEPTAKQPEAHGEHTSKPPAGAGEPESHAAHAMPRQLMPMLGFFGRYPMSREASGTSWQPEASPMHAEHRMRGDWMLMFHGFVHAIYSDQGGPRGDSDLFATSMAMAMGSREWRGGTLGVRAMVSADPALVGKEGYPLLFQTGETADGVRPLVDRQHPHDLLMELAASYSRPFGERRSWFVYAGLPGEPALGPPTFMHRFSGADHPEAPLGHHWLDSTHISFGVVTGGLALDRFKLDASLFNGREPDEERYDIEVRKLDSEAVRLTWNPGPSWSLQASRGWLDAPEQLEPGIDVVRTTASAIYHHSAARAEWQTLLAWGRNEEGAEEPTDAWLLDSAVELDRRHTLFARAERVENDDLFEAGDPLHGRVFEIVKLGVGYVRKWPLGDAARWGVGGLVNQYFTPRALDAAYSSDPTSVVVFARVETH